MFNKTAFLILIAIVGGLVVGFLVAEKNKAPNLKMDADSLIGEEKNIFGKAVVSGVDINILESFPVQVIVVAQGDLPDGCTRIDEAISRREGDNFFVDITTRRPTEVLCTQALVPFQERIPLNVVGLSKGDYRVNVNGVTKSFTLEMDNILQGSKESSKVENKNSEGQKKEELGAPSAPVSNVKFVPYTNKAIGYSVNRPDLWYWNHYTKQEIGNNNSLVDDYLIMDPSPLIGLESEYLGRIVVEVSSRSLNEIAQFSDINNLSSRPATVGGVSATRYEGVISNQLFSNMKWIEYQFEYNNRTFRLIYSKVNSTGDEEQVFEDLVKSFNF